MKKYDKINNLILLARREAKLNQTELGDKIGKSAPTIARWEKGQTTPDIDDVRKIAKALSKPISYFLPEEDSSPRSKLKSVEIPVLGEVPAGDINFIAGEELYWIELTPNLLKGESPEDIFALKIRGNCLKDARIHDGDHVIVSKTAPTKNGSIAVVRVDEECTCKRVFIQDDKLVLERINKNDPKQFVIDPAKENVEIIGKVIGCYNTNF